MKTKKQMLAASLATALLSTTGPLLAAEHSLNCTLHYAESLDHASAVAIEPADSQLISVRRGGVCLFEDGSVADKQFVMGMIVRGDGSTGESTGISVYTLDNGDTLTLSFSGNWAGGPFNGNYVVLSGTGAFDGASGTGTIKGLDSPWASTSIVEIQIDFTTP